jgi:nicotinamidase-related amidase
LLCGVEAHVCVSQTALDLLRHGYAVQVVADAVGSGARANWKAGLARARAAGAVITTTEMALFELLERAGTEQFRAVHRLLR